MRFKSWERAGVVFFFCQAEDGIRDGRVTGVQTCALPIFIARRSFRTRDVGALLGRLRTASAFTFRSRPAMLDAARRAVLRAKAAMPAWFGRLPRADIVVEPYPAFRERESVGEWNPPAEDGSRPGIYFLSTFDPGHK